MNNNTLYTEGKRMLKEGAVLGGISALEEASAAGSVNASAMLAFGSYVGKYGLPNDYVRAEKYLQVFLEQASPRNRDVASAHQFLGCIYLFGKTGKKDIKQALLHLKAAAERGDLIASYYHSKTLDKRSDQALKWVVMPMIFAVIVALVLLSQHYGWNDTVVEIISGAVVTGIVLTFIFRDKKYWLEEADRF